MKNIYLILTFCFLSSASLLAQQVPQGMKYQAVARNLKGEILVSEQIVLKITLSSHDNGNTVNYYSEIHTVKTNELGLFTLVIGEGKKEKADFKDIPWSTENIWMDVDIADKGKSGFTNISSSKLLAVPYAFHAETAGKILGANAKASAGPPPSSPWTTKGNSGTAIADYLGTSDGKGLSVRTNGIERMNITSGGDANILGNVNLNTTSSGATINNGNLTVANQSATSLTGTLDVTGNVAVNTNKFNINASNGNTGIAGTLTVGNIVQLNNVTQSTTKDDGALVTEGGVGIEKNLNVGGDLNVAGVSTLANLTVEGVSGKSINISNSTQGYLATFTNTNTGNGVNAGDGIKIKLGKEKALDLGASQMPTVGTFLPGITGAIGNSLFTNGAINTSLTPQTFFTNLYAGAESDVLAYTQLLQSSICKVTNIIVDKLNEGLGLNPNGRVILPATHLFGPSTAPQTVITAIDVILADAIPDEYRDDLNIPNLTIPEIKFPKIPNLPDCPPLINPLALDLSWPTASENPLTKNNEFIAFFDNNNVKVGAIRGQSLQDFIGEYTDIPHLVEVAATFVNGFDVDAGTPDPFSLVRMGAKAFNYFIQTYNAIGKIGVEYSSGNGDYAEWLERQNPDEVIGTGDIVAVKGGKITKNLTGAEQIMAVSHHPIVLGNVPDNERIFLGNNIAFMGQIPVKVMGPVKAGDYIVAKSEVPGYGVAVDPLNMKVEDYKLTVGRSWATDPTDGIKMINTVVGVHNNDFLNIVKRLKDQVEENDSRLKTIEAKLNISTNTNSTKEKRAFK
jgi:hypothetical protein